MAVLEPVELIIEDLKEAETLTVPLFPKNEEKGTRKIKFTNKIYVERSDIKLQDEKGFYGIAPNKVIGLKYAQPVLIKEVKSEGGHVTQVIAVLDQKVMLFLFRKLSLIAILTGSQLNRLLTAR